MLSLARKVFESIIKKLRKPIIVTASCGHLSELFGPTENRQKILRKKLSTAHVIETSSVVSEIKQ